MLLVPVLLVATVTLAVVRRRELLRPAVGLVVLAALVAGTWLFLHLLTDVTVWIPEDPDGADCLNSDRSPIRWNTGCGRAYLRHLLASAAPALVMLAVVVRSIVAGVRRRRAPQGARV